MATTSRSALYRERRHRSNTQLKGLDMKTIRLVLILSLLAFASTASAQTTATNTNDAAIKQTALDYIEGWYEGNAERMERALHPGLAKRIVRTDPKNNRSSLGQMSAMSLVQGRRAGYGKQTPKEKQLKDVTILDVYENAASVKVVASDWIDFLHMAKWNGRWVIVNVLWEMKPEKK